jgi:primase-polymerase (primpol)-like protein
MTSLQKPEKPSVLPVVLENVPEVIRLLPRWVLWQWELREDTQGKLKWSKVPYSGRLHECDEHWNRAKSNDATTWTTFNRVVQRLPHFDGIGFMLGDGFSGIDLDKCRDLLTGEIKEQDRQIVQEVQSYTEVSPSRTGVKLLVKAKKPDGRCRVGTFEMYSEGRYFTITGNHLSGTPTTIEARQEEVNCLHARMFPVMPKVPHNGKPHAVFDLAEHDLPDADILAAARTAKNGEKFNKLWAGD